VGIGAATGSDGVYAADMESLGIGRDRKLPLVTTRDTSAGEIACGGRRVANPFAGNGGLADLKDYPWLARHLLSHGEVVADRSCARRDPARWCRTPDPIHPGLAGRRKLLVPDIKGGGGRPSRLRAGGMLPP
jgi:hypothetical protein